MLDETGQLVPPQKLFSDYTFDYECDGPQVLENTAEQIVEAVEEFSDAGTFNWGGRKYIVHAYDRQE